MHSRSANPTNDPSRGASALLSILFFLSGAVALVYEVLWHRQFSLLFGATGPATAAILAAYFGGLCIGNFLFGKFGQRWTRPLLVYGLLELFIAGGALTVDPILNLYASVYPVLVARFGNNAQTLLLVKGCLGFLAIAVPTIAMGATLPVLANAVSATKQHLGVRIGWMYMLNTIGAAMGTVVVPAVLLPQLGMHKSQWLCVAANIVIGAIALRLWRTFRYEAPSSSETFLHRNAPSVLGLSFISGMATFALQVLWNRAFAQVHENSLQAFAFITTFFILAIALGAQLARLTLSAPRRADKFKMLGRFWFAGGILILAAPFIFLWLTGKLKYLPAGGHFFGLNGPLLVSALLVILIPIALVSTGVPFLLEELGSASSRSASAVTGAVLGMNTLGCICGAIAGGFVLPQLLGLWKAIFVSGVIFVALGTHIVRGRQSPNLLARLAPLVLLLIILQLDLPRTFLGSTERLLAVKEGSHGIAAVVERQGGSRRLKLNNHYVLGGTLATGDQRMQAHIPLSLAPTSGKAGFLGYGTGITAGGVLFHPNFTATAVELVPEVAQLASRFFADANGRFGSEPGTTLILDDARNFLRGTQDKFDVLIGDLVVPWRQGEGALYTLEHFRAVKSSLNGSGLFCAWVPMFQVNEAEFQIILRTFLEVFGHAYIWRGDFSPTQPAYGLMAFKAGESALSSANVTQALRTMRPDSLNPQLRAVPAFWMHFVGRINLADLINPRARVNSEDVPWLELGQGKGTRRNYFVGRELQSWETALRDKSRSVVESLPADARAGCQAGRLMVEFTQLFSEGRKQQALAIQANIREQLGNDLSELLFGK